MNHLVYKEYRATVEFDGDDHILVGRILGLNDIVGFHAEDAKAIEAAFHEAVEDYLDACAKIGKKPEREYSGNVMVRIAPGVHASAALAAQVSGRSLNQLTEDALREKAEKILQRV